MGMGSVNRRSGKDESILVYWFEERCGGRTRTTSAYCL